VPPPTTAFGRADQPTDLIVSSKGSRREPARSGRASVMSRSIVRPLRSYSNRPGPDPRQGPAMTTRRPDGSLPPERNYRAHRRAGLVPTLRVAPRIRHERNACWLRSTPVPIELCRLPCWPRAREVSLAERGDARRRRRAGGVVPFARSLPSFTRQMNMGGSSKFMERRGGPTPHETCCCTTCRA
jgi:hypothetical protein